MAQHFGSLDLRSGISLRSSQHFGSPALKNDSLSYFFKDRQQGVLYEIWDTSTLYQDEARTVPVTANGDPVRVMLDKSGNGNHAVAPSSSARPIYRTDGILHWLELDGVDDYMETGIVPWNGMEFATYIAASVSGGQSQAGLYRFLSAGGGSTSTTDNYFETYTFSPFTQIRLAQRYPTFAGYLSVEGLPNSGQPFIFSSSNNNTQSAIEVIPSLPRSTSPSSAFSSGNATLSLFRGYAGGLSRGKMFGFIWVSGEVSSADHLKVNNYLAAKAGVTI